MIILKMRETGEEIILPTPSNEQQNNDNAIKKKFNKMLIKAWIGLVISLALVLVFVIYEFKILCIISGVIALFFFIWSLDLAQRD